ncbi:MAG: cob(I)yrinic acid a,c-diamide adenosyltransferase [Solirubrobacterales bacterium]
MVNLTRIYTRLGDSGETHLGDMSRVAKDHPRIEAYGVVDELNSFVGLTLAACEVPGERREWLGRIQNELFDLGADLATPPSDEGRSRLRIEAGYVEWLESACDEVNAELPALKSFVIPGGSLLASYLHVCRTICRRAERLAIRIEDVSPEALQYLNRLSDLFFILAREANGPDEPLWEPGSSQQG